MELFCKMNTPQRAGLPQFSEAEVCVILRINTILCVCLWEVNLWVCTLHYAYIRVRVSWLCMSLQFS